MNKYTIMGIGIGIVFVIFLIISRKKWKQYVPQDFIKKYLKLFGLVLFAYPILYGITILAFDLFRIGSCETLSILFAIISLIYLFASVIYLIEIFFSTAIQGKGKKFGYILLGILLTLIIYLDLIVFTLMACHS